MKSTGLARFCSALLVALFAVAACECSSEAQMSTVASAIPTNQISTTNNFVFTNAGPKAVPRRASIILIVADGLGYGDLSCYGQTKFQTPNLDKLAAEGIRFTNYSTYNGSSSSHSALLVGKNLSHLAGADANVQIAAHDTTLAQILKNFGYHTGLIGEWNLGDENSAGAPWRKGFDEFAGYLSPADAENFYADFMWRSIPDISYDESYNDPVNGHWRTWDKANGPATPGKEMIYTNTAGMKGQYIPDFYTHAALYFIKNNLPDAANHYQPFFLLLNYPLPKTGLAVPSDAPFSGEAWPQAEKNRAALISRLDGYVGELQEQLQKSGMTNNAVIFFTSASTAQKAGGVDPEFFHSNISTNDLRVPMIVNWPGRISAGRVSGARWSPQDFLPTAAAISFVYPAPEAEGISVLPILLGELAPALPARRDGEF